MPKDKLTDYSTTNASNTDVGGVNIDEGMLPSGVNNAIREVLTHLKNFASGTDGIDVLSLADDDASAAMKIQAPASVTADTTLTLPDGDGSDGQALVTDGSGTLSWADLHSARNLLINGSFQVAQRATSSTTLSGFNTVDRFESYFNNVDQLAVTQSQSTTVPSGQGFANSFKLEVTTAETTLDADELAMFRQIIEAQNVQHLCFGTSSAKSVTLSFWVRSSLAGKYSVLFYNFDANRSNLQSFTINTADTWEYKTITIDGDTDSGGSFNNDNGQGLQVTWVLAAGTDWTGTPHTGWGAYTQTDDYAFSDQVNFIAQTGTFYITGVQLTVGDVALPFIHESYAETLAKCQRYFFRVPIEDNFEAHPMWNYATNVASTRIPLGVVMRTAPSVLLEGSTNSATDWDVYYNAAFRSINNINAANITSNSFRINVSASGLTSGGASGLYSRSATAGITASAEL